MSNDAYEIELLSNKEKRMTDRFNTVTSREMQSIIHSDSKSHILDLRTPSEFETAHISGSRLIPLRQVSGHRVNRTHRVDRYLQQHY